MFATQRGLEVCSPVLPAYVDFHAVAAEKYVKEKHSQCGRGTLFSYSFSTFSRSCKNKLYLP